MLTLNLFFNVTYLSNPELLELDEINTTAVNTIMKLDLLGPPVSGHHLDGFSITIFYLVPHNRPAFKKQLFINILVEQTYCFIFMSPGTMPS